MQRGLKDCFKSAARKAAEKAYWRTAGTVIAGLAAYNAAEIATARKDFSELALEDFLAFRAC